MLIGAIQGKIFLMDLGNARFRDLADKFLLPAPPAKMQQQLLGHLASLEQFVPDGSRICIGLQLQTGQ